MTPLQTGVDVRRIPEPAKAETALPRLYELKREASAEIPKPKKVGDPSPLGGNAIEDEVDDGVESRLEVSRDEGNIPRDLLGVINIEDSPSFPSFTESMIKDASGDGDFPR